MKLVIFIFCILVVVTSSFLGGVMWRDISVGISPQEAIEVLEIARDSHQDFVDHPEKIWWADNSEQDALWVERYNAIIRLIENK